MEVFRLVKSFEDKTDAYIIMRIPITLLDLLEATDCNEKDRDNLQAVTFEVVRKLNLLWQHKTNYTRLELEKAVPIRRASSSSNVFVVEFEVIADLQTELEAFLFQTKSSLDLLTKYLRFLVGKNYISLMTYKNEGDELLKILTKSIPDPMKPKAEPLRQLISNNKPWIRELVEQRDNVAHFLNDLEDYDPDRFIVARSPDSSGQLVLRPELRPGLSYGDYLDETWTKLVDFHESFAAFSVALRFREGISLYTAPERVDHRRYFKRFDESAPGASRRLTQEAGLLVWKGRLGILDRQAGDQVQSVLRSDLPLDAVKELARTVKQESGLRIFIGPYPGPPDPGFRGYMNLQSSNHVVIALNPELRHDPALFNYTLAGFLALIRLRFVLGFYEARAVSDNRVIVKGVPHEDLVSKIAYQIEKRSVIAYLRSLGIPAPAPILKEMCLKSARDYCEVMEKGGDLRMKSGLLGFDVSKVIDFLAITSVLDDFEVNGAELGLLERFQALFAQTMSPECRVALHARQILIGCVPLDRNSHNAALADLINLLGFAHKVVLLDQGQP